MKREPNPLYDTLEEREEALCLPGPPEEVEMSRLERAALEIHKLLWDNTGDTGDWPIAIKCDADVEERLVAALNELRGAAEEVSPGCAPWPPVLTP